MLFYKLRHLRNSANAVVIAIVVLFLFGLPVMFENMDKIDATRQTVKPISTEYK